MKKRQFFHMGYFCEGYFIRRLPDGLIEVYLTKCPASTADRVGLNIWSEVTFSLPLMSRGGKASDPN